MLVVIKRMCWFVPCFFVNEDMISLGLHDKMHWFEPSGVAEYSQKGRPANALLR